MPSAGFWKTLRDGFKRIAALPLPVVVQFYRYCISPLTPPACRLPPTCSQDALESTRKSGAGQGSCATLPRLARCHPWGGSGYDPVP